MLGYLFGLAAIGGGVFLLQRLRIQRTERVVPTLLFWQAALRETQARRLTERFRDPLVFLLLFAIGALLWTAAQAPAGGAAGARDHWVFVDGTVAGQRGGRAALGLERAGELSADLPHAATTIWWLGGQGAQPLALPGDAEPLFEARAGALDPTSNSPVDAAAAHIVDATAARLAGQGARGLTLHLVATPPLLDAARPALDALAASSDGRLQVEALPLEAALEANDGILALRAEPAASGSAARADLWVATTGPVPTLTANGSAPRVEPAASNAQEAWFVARDVALDGATWTAALPNTDAFPIDDHATLALPTVAAVAVSDPALLASGEHATWAAAWRAALATVVAADSGLEVSGAPAVTLAFGDAPSAEGAAFFLDPTADAIHVSGPSAATFAEALDALGLELLPKGLVGPDAEAPTNPLAGRERLAVRVAESADPMAPRTLVLPAALIAPPFEWSEERRLPLLVALGVRWLGEGATRSFRGQDSPDLVDADVTREASAEPAADAPRIASAGASFWPLLGLLALGLLLYEWRAVAGGRVP